MTVKGKSILAYGNGTRWVSFRVDIFSNLNSEQKSKYRVPSTVPKSQNKPKKPKKENKIKHKNEPS